MAELKTADFPKRVARKVSALPEADALAIIESLVSVYMLFGRTGKPTSEIVNDDTESILASRDKYSKPILTQREPFATRLESLLSIESLQGAIKALDIITEHQKVFTGARILTDIRPVFTEDVKKTPLAAVIVHNLKLEYFESDENHELFIALDHDDLTKLIESLQRALEKDSTLRRLLANSRLPHIDT